MPAAPTVRRIPISELAIARGLSREAAIRAACREGIAVREDGKWFAEVPEKEAPKRRTA